MRSLAVDARGNVIAGTDPSGLVWRISPTGQGFVLYEAGKREVTALAIAPNGAIYAAATGIKGLATAPAAPPAQPAARGPGLAPAPAQPAPTAATIGVQGGSDIYRIDPDGYARRVWTHPQDVVFSLTFDAQGKPVAGTGNRGLLYRLDSDFEWTRLADLNPSQITGTYRSAQRRVCLQRQETLDKFFPLDRNANRREPLRAMCLTPAPFRIGAA